MRLTLDNNEDKELQAVFQGKRPDFRDLTPRKKIHHIWIYHKWKFLIPLLVIAVGLMAFFIAHIEKESILSVSFLNSTADFTDYADIKEDFASYADINLEKNDIIIEALVSSSSTREQIAVRFFSEAADVVICDENSFDLYYENGCFAPLEDYIPDDYFDKYPFEPLTHFSREDKTEHIYGIVLKDNDLLRKYYTEEPVFAISLKAPHSEMAAEYLQYLLQMQKDYSK